MTDELDKVIEYLKELDGRATPGPFHAHDRGVGWEVHRPGPSGCGDVLWDGFRETVSQADAEALSTARSLLPVIIPLLEAARRMVTEHEDIIMEAAGVTREVVANEVDLEGSSMFSLRSALAAIPAVLPEEAR